MKTTKKQFEQFQAEFLKWVDKFGLKQYKIYFDHAKLNDNYAEIHTEQIAKHARVKMCKDADDSFDPASSAKHEAIHLLLAKLSYMAECRFLSNSEVSDEEESIVRILEKVLND